MPLRAASKFNLLLICENHQRLLLLLTRQCGISTLGLSRHSCLLASSMLRHRVPPAWTHDLSGDSAADVLVTSGLAATMVWYTTPCDCMQSKLLTTQAAPAMLPYLSCKSFPAHKVVECELVWLDHHPLSIGQPPPAAHSTCTGCLRPCSGGSCCWKG